jgi:hypothetical protein
MAIRTLVSGFTAWFAMFFAAAALLPATMVQLEEECSSESVELQECEAATLRRDCHPVSVRGVACGVIPTVSDGDLPGPDRTPFHSAERSKHNGVGAYLLM